LELAFSMSLTVSFGTRPSVTSGNARCPGRSVQIPEDEWMAKHAEISAEHETEGVRDELRTGLKDWIASEFHKQFRSKGAAIPNNTKVGMLYD
jgi:hypothetical protein